MSYMTLVSPTFSIDVPEDALEIKLKIKKLEKILSFFKAAPFSYGFAFK